MLADDPQPTPPVRPPAAPRLLPVVAALLAALAPACGPPPERQSPRPEVVVYSGRSESLAGPLFERLEEE